MLKRLLSKQNNAIQYLPHIVSVLLFILFFLNKLYIGRGINIIGIADSYGELLDAHQLVASNFKELSLITLSISAVSFLTGISEIYVGFFIAFILLLIIPFLLLDIVQIKNRIVKSVFLLVFFLNPLVIFYIGEPDKPLWVVFFFLVSIWGVHRYDFSQNMRYLVISICSLVLAILSYITGFFTVPIMIFLYYQVMRKRGGVKIKGFTSKTIQLIAIIGGVVFLGGALFYMSQQSVAQLAYTVFIRNISQGFSGEGFNKLALFSFIQKSANFFSPILFYTLIPIGIVSLFKKSKSKRFSNVGETGLLLWLLLFLLIFGMQRLSFSHNNRYVFYILIPLISCFMYGLDFLIRNVKPWGGVVLLVIASFFYIPQSAEAVQFRYLDRWQVHVDFCRNELSRGEFNEENKILGVGWKSLILHCTYARDDFEDFLVPTGWSKERYFQIDKEYIEDNNIRYFLYDKTGDDYIGSSEKLVIKFSRLGYSLSESARYSSKTGNYYVVLYQVSGT